MSKIEKPMILKEDLINDPEVYEENYEYFDLFFIYIRDNEELTILLHNSTHFGLVFKDEGIWEKFFGNTHSSPFNLKSFTKDLRHKEDIVLKYGDTVTKFNEIEFIHGDDIYVIPNASEIVNILKSREVRCIFGEPNAKGRAPGALISTHAKVIVGLLKDN